MFIATRVIQAQKESGIKALYFRVVWLTSGATGAYSASASEIVFSKTLGGSQISGYTPFASDALSATYKESKAFDSDAATCWVSGTKTIDRYIGVQYSAAQAPLYLRLQAPPFSVNRAPTTFRVDISNNGITYTTIYTSPTQAAWGVNESRDFKIQ